jgi:hypothetical protein
MPILNSNPGAPTAIFLDFDGDSTSNSTPYDEDGNSATFNITEQLHIHEAWRGMSSHYSFFDVNVTTLSPSVPTAWVVIGNNIDGGYSYVNVFPNTKAESFVNSNFATSDGYALAHEIGHNFGLRHQSNYDSGGVKAKEYASANDPLHGFIMGGAMV